MRIMAILMVLAFGAVTAACEDRATAGTLIGAGAGAAIGSQFGSGLGRAGAAAAGAVIGGYLGNRIGRYMDERDRARAESVANHAMSDNDVGMTSSWSNPDTGNQGQITPTSAQYRGQGGRTCRDFQETITLRDGRTETVNGRRCRRADGSWEFVG